MDTQHNVETRDEQIARAIEGAIGARMQRHTPPINVAVQGGTVTLTGHVANQASKEATVEMARGMDGVYNVVDNLVVGGGHPFLDWVFPWRDPNQDLIEHDRGDW